MLLVLLEDFKTLLIKHCPCNFNCVCVGKRLTSLKSERHILIKILLERLLLLLSLLLLYLLVYRSNHFYISSLLRLLFLGLLWSLLCHRLVLTIFYFWSHINTGYISRIFNSPACVGSFCKPFLHSLIGLHLLYKLRLLLILSFE